MAGGGPFSLLPPFQLRLAWLRSSSERQPWLPVAALLFSALFAALWLTSSSLQADTPKASDSRPRSSSWKDRDSNTNGGGRCSFVQPSQPPRLACCGHRGARRLSPENTLASFKKALEVGANCIELDVHVTSDRRLAVGHGRTIRERMLTTPSRVEDLGWDILRQLDAGSWFSSDFAGERIPSLEEVVEMLWDRPVQVVVELKHEQCEDEGAGARRRLVNEAKGAALGQANIQLFPEKLIQMRREVNPSISVARYQGHTEVADSQNKEFNEAVVSRSRQLSAIGHKNSEDGASQRASQNCMADGDWERIYAKTLVDWLVAFKRPMPYYQPQLGLIFSSFNHRLIDEVAEAFATHRNKLGPLSENVFGLAYIFGPRDNTTAAMWHEGVGWAAAHDSLVEAMTGERPIISWVTDTLLLLRQQVALGVQAVTTNDPTLCPALCQPSSD